MLVLPIQPSGARHPSTGGFRACLLALVLCTLACGGKRDALWAKPHIAPDSSGESAAGRDGATTGMADGAAASGSEDDTPAMTRTCLPVPEPNPSPPLALMEPTPESITEGSDGAARYFAIYLRDRDSGAAVPQATLTTVHHVDYRSDGAGAIAFYEADLMGLAVRFTVTHPDYQAVDDSGATTDHVLLTPTQDGSVELLLQRNGAAPAVSDDRSQSTLIAAPVAGPKDCFGVRLIDQQTRNGVPLITLSDGQQAWVSDSQGYVALCEGVTFDAPLSLEISGHGYQYSAGIARLQPSRGGRTQLELTRTMLAERLLRLTGGGIYRDSERLGLSAPHQAGTLAGQVISQDAVSSLHFQGQTYWLWGITELPHLPGPALPNSAATSMPQRGSWLSPPTFDFLVDDRGQAQSVPAALAPLNRPTWVDTVFVLESNDDDARLYAVYVKPNLDLSIARRGISLLDPTTFALGQAATTFDDAADAFPVGQPVRFVHGTTPYLYFARGVRVAAERAAVENSARYEIWSAVQGVEQDTSAIELDDEGKPIYAFRPSGHATTARALTAAGLSTRTQENPGHIDIRSGEGIELAGVTAQAYSPYRGRVVRLVQQVAGSSSFLGELWFLQGDTPMGPWVYTHKVVSHDRYSFYRPWLHPTWDPSGRDLYFEGSYTRALAGDAAVATPRYDRNQILYRLQLSDPRLITPVAFYEDGLDLVPKERLPAGAPASAARFFALTSPTPDHVAVYWDGAACEPRSLRSGPSPTTPPLFYARDPADDSSPGHLSMLYAVTGSAGAVHYETHEQTPDTADNAEPVARVYPSPTDVAWPVSDYLPPSHATAPGDLCLQLEAGKTERKVTLRVQPASAEGAAGAQYRWYRYAPRCLLSEGPTVELSLQAGLHGILLETRDAEGHRSVDHTLIRITR